MHRTNIYLDAETYEDIERIKARYRLSNSSTAIRLAVKEFAATLAKQEAAEQRRAEELVDRRRRPEQ